MIESKQAMAKNIIRYMERDNKRATDICKALGFKPNTFSDWIHARSYPRIDAIEKLADYFHVSKADLVEDFKVSRVDALIITDDIRILLEAAEGCSSDDLKMATDLLLRLKRDERVKAYSRALSDLKKKE